MHQALPSFNKKPPTSCRFAACCCNCLPSSAGFVSVLGGGGLGLGFHKLLPPPSPPPPPVIVLSRHGFQKWNGCGRRIYYGKTFLWGSAVSRKNLVVVLGKENGRNVLGFSPAAAALAAWEDNNKKKSSSYDGHKMRELHQPRALSSLSGTGRDEQKQQQQQQQPWKIMAAEKAAEVTELVDGSRIRSDGGREEEEKKKPNVGRKARMQRVRKEGAAVVAAGDVDDDDGDGCDEEEKKNESMMTAEERLQLFENWAATKISKEGQGAVAIIREMRQALSPGSPELFWSRGRPDGASADKGNKNVQNKNVPFSSLSCNETEKDNAAHAVEKARGLQQETHSAYSMSSGVSQRTKANSMVRFIEVLRTNPQSLRKLPKEKDPLAGMQQRPNVVKRNAKVPEDWDGPGGAVVLIDKPKGWTSFAVCSKIRYLLGIKKVGHAGTLDPMATGLLVVCVGKATKLADSYQAMTKVYSGTMRLGEYTPSYDADTEVTKTLPWEHIRDSDITRAKQAFIGDIMQVPPMFSAIKVGGERLYKKARRGEEISVPPRSVTIYDFYLERNSDNRRDFDFIVICSKGTYVRTLCADLGQALGSYAHLTALRREKIGNLSVDDAWSVADVADHCDKLSSMQLNHAGLTD